MNGKGGGCGVVQAELAPVVTQAGIGMGSGHLVICSRVGMGLGRGTAGRGVACVLGGSLWRHCVGLRRWDSNALAVKHHKNKHFKHRHLSRTLFMLQSENTK